MKKGYKRLLIYEIVLISILILNSFVSNILHGYIWIIFLIMGLVFFKMRFGFEKDRTRYVKDILIEEVIFLITFFILYYLLGVFIGYAKIPNYYNLKNMIEIVIPIILTIILQEYFRYQMLNKSEGNVLLLITTILLFVFFDIKDSIFYFDSKNFDEVFKFIALVFLPAISMNLCCTYITKKVGYRPVILYLLIWKLYNYLIPIVPNVSEYLYSIINLAIPILLGYRIYKVFDKIEDNKELMSREKIHYFGGLTIPIIIVLIVVYFNSGYFKYESLAIASGSMEPVINIGDIVIVEKVKDIDQEISEGEVIAFRKDNIIIVHRVSKKMKTADSYFYYTKGDANEDLDNFKLTKDMIIGKVVVKVPMIGLPAVWFNKLR